MGVLDSVVEETAAKAGISQNTAGSLLSGLLAIIFQRSGGFSGFLDQFRQAGLSNTVSSWLRGEPQAIRPDEVASVVGENAMSNLASKAGISTSVASSALALMLPKVVQRIAPGGSIPSRIPNEIASYMPAASPDYSPIPDRGYSEPVPHRRSASPLWAILAVVVLALLGIWVWQNRSAQRAASRAGEEAARVGAEAGRAAERAGTAVRERTSEALAGLRPGATADELIGSLNVATITFAPGSAQISPGSYDVLNRAAVGLKSVPPNTVVEVSGHAEGVGNATSAMQLAQQRADAVREYLIRQGVAPQTLVARGYPAGSDAQNRTVTFSTR